MTQSLPAKVQTQAHSARCAAGCAMGGRRAGRIVDRSVGSRLMSGESTKAGVATKAGRVWAFLTRFLTETWWDGLVELEPLVRFRHDRRR